MASVLVIRHAESAPDFALDERDWPLSARGREQAREIAGRLADQRIDRIYSSPYVRAIDTVQPLAARLGVAIEIVDELRERALSPGAIPDFFDVVERSWRDFDFALPGCESARAAQHRAVTIVERLVADNAGWRIVISSHGQWIALLLHAHDPSFGFEQWRAMPNPYLIELPPLGQPISSA